jgi:adenylate kinase family enzyme
MRIAVLGNAGSGKSTLSVKLADQLSLPLCELDTLLWRDGWTLAPADEYENAHRAVLADDDWIIEGLGMKETIGDRIDRATHIILCDFPVWQNFWLLAERQMKWASSELDLRPGGQPKMPPTRALFETVWAVEQDWMPTIRKLVAKEQLSKTVHRLNSFEALADFTFTSE